MRALIAATAVGASLIVAVALRPGRRSPARPTENRISRACGRAAARSAATGKRPTAARASAAPAGIPPRPSSSRQTIARQGAKGAPYQDWAAKKVLEAYNRRGIDDPTAQCLPGGVPRSVMLGLFPQQFVQTPKQIIILYEYMHTFRVIPIGGKHPDDLIPSYMGNSVAHWEGDTLVVDAIGFNDKTWLSGTGTFHSEDLHITERYTRVDKDRIDYEVTMEDPKVLTKPWKLTSSLMLREGTRLEEYICAENNLDPARYEQLLKAGVKITR